MWRRGPCSTGTSSFSCFPREAVHHSVLNAPSQPHVPKLEWGVCNPVFRTAQSTPSAVRCTLTVLRANRCSQQPATQLRVLRRWRRVLHIHFWRNLMTFQKSQGLLHPLHLPWTGRERSAEVKKSVSLRVRSGPIFRILEIPFHKEKTSLLSQRLVPDSGHPLHGVIVKDLAVDLIRAQRLP